MFAFNNESTDYVGMAAWNAANIQRHLKIPVAVVTDCPNDQRLSVVDKVISMTAESGGTRYFEDYDKTVTWYNAARPDAYNLSPWDQTLLLDADYVVASDQLGILLGLDQDLLCHDHAVDVRGQALESLNCFGNHAMPMCWATVMVFRKSLYAQYVFDCMNMVRQHWQHYRDLYSINNRTYRNDFALTIALNIVNGHTWTFDAIPWSLLTALPGDTVSQITQDSYQVKYKSNNQQHKQHTMINQDFHAMCKSHLGDIVAAS